MSDRAIEIDDGRVARLSRRATLGFAGSLSLFAIDAPGMASAPASPGNGLRSHRTLLGPAALPSEMGSGRTFAADLAFLEVPADHDRPTAAPPFTLRFARFPAKRPASGPPVFYLFGGPSAVSDLWAITDGRYWSGAISRFIDAVTDYADLVLIDHRGGYGCAYPRLVPLVRQAALPLDRPSRDLDWRSVQQGLYRQVIDDWGNVGVDLRLFTTPQLVRDLDMVRLALGYERIRLIADSNGTYRSREYLRQFQSQVDSALLFISHGYQKVPWPDPVRRALARVDKAFAADPISQRFPSVAALADDLTAELDHAPVTAAFKAADGEERRIVLDGADFATYFWSIFADNEAIRRAPAKLWNIRQRDLTHFARVAAAARQIGVAGVDAYDAAFSGSAMPDAAEASLYRRQAGASFYLNRLYEYGAADSWPLPRDARPSFVNYARVTYVMGEWDLRTPIDGLKPLDDRARQLIVNPAQGHESGLDDATPTFWEEPMIRAFLEGRPLVPRAPLPREFGSFFK